MPDVLAAHGSYFDLEAGVTAWALHDLTGAPTETLKLATYTEQKQREALWETLRAHRQAGFLLCCSTDAAVMVSFEA